MSSLLEEAIVDAKALKEAALKNAEDAVLEKYSGEVKKALDTLLEQTDPVFDDTADGGGDTNLMEFADDIPYAFQNEQIGAPREEEIIEIDLHGLKARLEEEGTGAAEEDLNDVLEIAETMVQEEEDEIDRMADREAPEDAAELGASTVLPLKEEDEEINITSESLSELIEELILDMIPRPEGWSSVNSADNSVVQANNVAMANARAAHQPEDEDDEEGDEEMGTVDVVPDTYLDETKISELTESTREFKTLLIESKYQLTRLNLENAKLVYQNKALNSASLNERQKQQIVEAVRSATSVEEAGMIFETIQNAVGSAPDQRTRPQTLREAVQRPTSLLLSSKKNNEATIDPNMGRMLRLAGLNK